MDYTELKIEMRQKLKDELEVAYPVGDQLMVIRCPFCGDSRKDPRKGHFYIKLNMRDPNEPILYSCARCGEAGMLTPSVMRSLELNDLKFNSALITVNNKSMKEAKQKRGLKDNSYDFKIPYPNVDDLRIISKHNYINDRLGLDLSIEEMIKRKTIFSLGDFLRSNEIKTYPRMFTPQRMKLLHDQYVGWLTVRNEFINFRNTKSDSNKRYDKYPIFDTLENTRKFYTIPNDIDLLSTRTITINVGEGVFDIWGIYDHIFDGEIDNMIYAAVTGSAFTSVVKYFINMGVIGNVDLNIFSDSDHNVAFYRKLVREVKPWLNKITIYYNDILDTKGKSDFGVSKNKIKLRREKL